MYTAGRSLLLLGSFFVGLVGTLVTIGELSTDPRDNMEESVVRLERGAVNRGIESVSLGERYRATVTDAGSRSQGSAPAQSVDLFEIRTAGKEPLQLYQYGGLDTLWSEFGKVEWTADSKVKFVHSNEVDPLGKYQLEFVLHEE